MTLLPKFVEAIKIHEGWFPGSRSQRNHNPGNLRYVGQAKATGKDDKGFAIFANDTDGEAALSNQIKIAISGQSKIYYPDMTILQFFEKYAPSADNNNPKAYAEDVAQRIGKDINFQIRNLDDEILPDKKTLEIRINGYVVYSAEI